MAKWFEKINAKKAAGTVAIGGVIYGAYALGANNGVTGLIDKLKTFARNRRANQRLEEEARKDGFTKYKNLSGDSKQFAVVSGGNQENSAKSGKQENFLDMLLSLIGV